MMGIKKAREIIAGANKMKKETSIEKTVSEVKLKVHKALETPVEKAKREIRKKARNAL